MKQLLQKNVNRVLGGKLNMYKIGICGHFGEGKKLLNGQTVKTKILSDELKKVYGNENIKIVDTHNWISNPFKLLISCYKLINKCENIIILPAHNGVKMFLPLFAIFNLMFKKKLHYIVIGGWLPEFLSNNSWLKRYAYKFDGIFVETYIMKKKLEEIGLKNVRYLPNFKRLNIIEEENLIYPFEKPFKVCTFSRVMKEKGIELAIEAVTNVNSFYGKEIFQLDIYGQVDEGYKIEFQKIMEKSPNYIKYKGSISYDEVVNVLKNYYLLIFPTYYEGEGFAGTFIDAFSAGVPIIASDWRYNSEILDDGKTGSIFKSNDIKSLINTLIKYANNPEETIEMKSLCLKEANKYRPEIAINSLTQFFN